jgi:DNA-binding LytR/AlgR family response regulator
MNSETMISCVVVDDELSSQNVIKHFIAKTDILKLQYACFNTSEANTYLKLNPGVELLFLDINMPNQSGLEFYKSLQFPPKVIFTTAYPQYAVEGFEVNATDYLLKPFSYDRFLDAVGKVIKSLNKKVDYPDSIIINENKSLHKVLYKDILFVEAYGDYVKVHSISKILVTNSTFKKFTGLLPDFFLRVHKSFCINSNHLQQVKGNVIFINNHKIPIGQTYKNSIMEKLI